MKKLHFILLSLMVALPAFARPSSDDEDEDTPPPVKHSHHAKAKANSELNADSAANEDTGPVMSRRAADRTIGVGLAIGDPTGLEVRSSISPKNSLHGGLSFLGHSVAFFGDFVWDWHNSNMFGPRTRRVLTPYLGGGLMIASHSGYAFSSPGYTGTGFGVRVPVGVEWNPKEVPVGVFAELAPGILFSDGAWGIFDLATGAVYYF